MYTVLYDETLLEVFEAEVQPLLLPFECTFIPFDKEALPSLTERTTVFLWLSDTQLYKVLPYAAQNHWLVGFIPHPEMNRAQQAFSVFDAPQDAIDDIVQTEHSVFFDFLLCNSHLVLGSVTVGNPVTMRPMSNLNEPFWVKLKHFFSMAFNFSQMTLKFYKLETDKQNVVQTAALGLTIVNRASSNDFTKQIIKEQEDSLTSINAVILSPRSIVEVLHFLITQILTKHTPSHLLPDYVGHIKTESLKITSSQSIELQIDEQSFVSDTIELVVQKGALSVLGKSRNDKLSTPELTQKESVRLSGLPVGQAIKELADRPLPWIHHEDQDEVKETFLTLRENSKATESYLVLMVLSTLLATIGLFANSAPVIIGAMILAPLMAPIISLSMGVLRQNLDLISVSSKTLITGVFLALAFGTLLTVLTPLQIINDEIGARLSPTILDLGIAIISGIAGAYANARSEVAKSLAGVAIAVALVPPLAVSGIGIGWLDWHVFWGAFLLFMTNLFGIVLAASATFLVMGFSPFHLAKKGILISLVFALVVSIPLTLSFNKMVEEQNVLSALEDWKLKGITLKDIKIRSGNPTTVSVKLLTKQSLEEKEIDDLKLKMETLLDQKIRLEVTTAILRE